MPQLRALIVVPTGDLASQVGQVFQPLCEAAGLKITVAKGPTQTTTSNKDDEAGKQNDMTYQASTKQTSRNKLANDSVVCAGSSDSNGIAGTDILVTPPGRLVALIRQLSGVFLEWLQILVVDEADRILRQTYQGWLPLVLSSWVKDAFCSVGDRWYFNQTLTETFAFSNSHT